MILFKHKYAYNIKPELLDLFFFFCGLAEIEVDYVHIGSGLTYFTTVTACNTADLCTSAISDGLIVDNSPPNVGVVIDGTSSEDIEYQSIK